MLHLKHPQGQEALGSGFSIVLWGPRNIRKVPSHLWKIVNFQTFLSYLFCLIHWLTFSTFPAQSQGVLLISFTIFLPGNKVNSLHWGGNNSLHWGGNHSLPKMMVTLPGNTIQGCRSGKRKRCPHVADESTVPPAQWLDKLKSVLINIYITWHWQLFDVNGNTHSWMTGGIQVFKRKRLPAAHLGPLQTSYHSRCPHPSRIWGSFQFLLVSHSPFLAKLKGLWSQGCIK